MVFNVLIIEEIHLIIEEIQTEVPEQEMFSQKTTKFIHQEIQEKITKGTKIQTTVPQTFMTQSFQI